MQWGRYGKARWHQANGRFVIFDRYTYDAMLPSSKKLSRGKELRRWALAHACPAPDLILFLDAPGEVLYARKGEHSPAFLEEQRQGYLQLRQELPQMQVVNVDRDPDCVRREVTSIIWRDYAQNLN
jgi:thymidylate kinase